MMPTSLIIKIHTSKIYLLLTLSIYCLCLFCAWYYFYNFWLSLVVSVALSFWLANFLPKNIFLSRPNSIVEVVFDKENLKIKKNNQTTQQYPWFYPAYRSRFLVIINTRKEFVVIFKDALASQSLSQLNRYLNTDH